MGMLKKLLGRAGEATYTFPASFQKRIEKISDSTENKRNNVQIIRDAFVLFEKTVKETRKGYELCFIDPKTGDQTQIDLGDDYLGKYKRNPNL